MFGKTKAPVEFGAKVEISIVNEYVRMEKLVAMLMTDEKV